MSLIHAMLAGLLALSLSGFARIPEEKPSAPPEATATSEPNAYQQATAPGPYHKLLDPLAGRWKADVRIWEKPGAEPMITQGNGSHTWIFGGRYLKMEFTGQFMGESFIGLGFLGFDTARRKYISVWMDNMSTWVMYSTGTVSQDGKTFTFNGSYKDPVSGAMKHQRDETRIEGTERVVSRSYDIRPGGGGEEFLSMEIVYTRVK